MRLVIQHSEAEKKPKLGFLSFPQPGPTLSMEWTQAPPHSWQGRWKVTALPAPGELTKSRGKVAEPYGPWGRAATLGAGKRACSMRDRERQKSQIQPLYLKVTSAHDWTPFQNIQREPKASSSHKAKISFPMATKTQESLFPTGRRLWEGRG